MTDFREVSPKAPCEICGKPDWCRRSQDGCHECHRSADEVPGFKLLKVTQSGFGLYRTVDSDRMAKGHTSKPKNKGPKAKKLFATPEGAIGDILKPPGFRRAKHVATWTYHHADGTVAFRVARFDFPDRDKQFRPLHPINGQWAIGDPPGKLPLCRLPELLKSKGRIYVLEGEKCVELARQIGLVATTSAHGAQSPQKTDWTPLAGCEVVILRDKGRAGARYVRAVAEILTKLGCTVRIVELPGLVNDGDDIEQFIAAQREDVDVAGLIDELADKAPVWATPKANEILKSAPEWRPFPVEVLPEPVRTFVTEGAASLGVDDSFIALPALASCAAAIGTTRRARLKSTWPEPSVLWTVIVAKSGQIKSAAIDLGLEPIRRIQDDAFDQYAAEMKDHERQLAEYNVDHKEWERTRHKAGEDRPEEPKEPVCERFITTEATIEAVAALLQDSPRGLLLARDELAAWIKGFDQYRRNGGADIAAWAEMHRAGTLTIDRKTGRRVIHVRNAAVSVTGTIQPRTLRHVLCPEYFESGFSARLLMTMPPPRRKRWSEQQLSRATRDHYAKIVRELLMLSHTTDSTGRPSPVDLSLSEAAKRAWVTFFNEHADRQFDTENDDLTAAFSKLEGYAARFALIFHFIKWAAGNLANANEIDAHSIEAGASLARWFCDETERIYEVLRETEEQAHNRGLIQFIRSRGGKVNCRDLMRAGPCYGTADEAREAINRLEKAGSGRWESVQASSKGGAPKELFRLHERAVVDTTPHSDPENVGSVSVSSVSSQKNACPANHGAEGERQR